MITRAENRIIWHLSNIEYNAIYFDYYYHNLIYPSIQDSLQDMINKSIKISWDDLSNKDCSLHGVYGFSFNGRGWYIGETVNTFRNRFIEHKKALEDHIHHNKYLQRMYDKYKLPEIYLIEQGQYTEDYKFYFKIKNLMREFYYTQLVLQEGLGVSGAEDSLKIIYSDYYMADKLKECCGPFFDFSTYETINKMPKSNEYAKNAPQINEEQKYY